MGYSGTAGEGGRPDRSLPAQRSPAGDREDAAKRGVVQMKRSAANAGGSRERAAIACVDDPAIGHGDLT